MAGQSDVGKMSLPAVIANWPMANANLKFLMAIGQFAISGTF
jgi:hypothetical protein